MRRDEMIVTVLKPDGSYVITNVPAGFQLEVFGDGTVILVDMTPDDD